MRGAGGVAPSNPSPRRGVRFHGAGPLTRSAGAAPVKGRDGQGEALGSVTSRLRVHTRVGPAPVSHLRLFPQVKGFLDERTIALALLPKRAHTCTWFCASFSGCVAVLGSVSEVTAPR